MSRQRIAVVTTSYPRHAGDPAGHFVEAEVQTLQRAGADVTVFALRGSAFGWPGVASRLTENPLRIFSATKEIARVAMAISRNRSFSRVIAHWAVPCAWPIARNAEAVEVVSHGADVRLLTRLPRAARHRLVANILKNASSWRFPSEALLTDLLSSLEGDLRAQTTRIAMVRAPAISIEIDARDVDEARADQKSRARGQKVFAVAARLVASKNVDRAIAYAAKKNATLFVIGDGPERTRLEAFARARHANAYFLGVLSRPRTLAHIAAADALVHMSQQEGLSSVVREANALGTLVITEP